MACAGCGEPGPTCKACSHSNWAIACGCDSHGDHGGCDKVCERYGCAHPRGLIITGTLEESDRYHGEVPPRYLVERAIEQARGEAEKKFQKKMLKLDRLVLKLDTYPEA